jgi:hypothetical protein
MTSLQQDLFPKEESLSEDSPAKTCQLPENVRDWLAREADCFGKSPALRKRLKRSGSLLKMFPDFCPANEVETWASYSAHWPTSGIAVPGGFWTHNTLECPSEGVVVSSLLTVLETPPVPQKYFLSAQGCQGIQNRAEKRGVELPPILRQALLSQILAEPTDNPDTLGTPREFEL